MKRGFLIEVKTSLAKTFLRIRSRVSELYYPRLFHYVLKHFLLVFFIVSALVSSFFLGLRILGMSYALLVGVSLKELFVLSLLLLPSFFTVLFPLSVYISTYITVSRMRSDREIVVLEALGYRIRELFTPFFVASFFIFVFLLINILVFEPISTGVIKRKAERLMESYKLNIKGDTFIDAFKGCILYVAKNDGGKLTNIFLYRKEGGKVTIVTGKEGEVKRVKGDFVLVIENGTMEVSGERVGSLDFVVFNRMEAWFTPSEKFSPKKLFSIKDKELDIFSLARRAREAFSSGDVEESKALSTMLHFKISLVFSILIIPVIAFSVGSGRLFGAFSGIKGLIFFLISFYGLFAFFQEYGLTFGLPPFVSSYLPDLFMLVCGISIFKMVKE